MYESLFYIIVNASARFWLQGGFGGIFPLAEVLFEMASSNQLFAACALKAPTDALDSPTAPDVPNKSGQASFEIVLCEGLVQLLFDYFAQSWIVVHTRTGERYQLPAPQPEWMIVFADDGQSFVFDLSDPALMIGADQMFQSRLRKQSVKDSMHRDFVVVKMGPHGPVSHMPSVDSLNSHCLGKVHIRCGRPRAQDVFTVAKFIIPRFCCHCYWRILSLRATFGVKKQFALLKSSQQIHSSMD